MQAEIITAESETVQDMTINTKVNEVSNNGQAFLAGFEVTLPCEDPRLLLTHRLMVHYILELNSKLNHLDASLIDKYDLIVHRSSKKESEICPVESVAREPDLQRGDEVKVKFLGSIWHTGKIRRDRRDGTYDIVSDVREIELQVSKGKIRPLQSDKVKAALVFGATVVSERDDLWYLGKISLNRLDGTYDIDYADGTSKRRVLEDNICVLESGVKKSKLTKGDKILLNFLGCGTWYPATIHGNNIDGTYDVEFAVGEFPIGVAENMICALESEGGKSKLKLGDKVVVNYDGSFWYAGTIARVNENGQYDITFDDGEFRSDVEEKLICALEPEAGKSTLKEPANVVANFLDSGLWLQGELGFSLGKPLKHYVYFNRCEYQIRVKENDICILEPEAFQSRIGLGDEVEVDPLDRSIWHPGKVTQVRYHV